MLKLPTATLIACLAVSGTAHSFEFESGITRNQVIELYTSEGCNSCPPAEKWLNAFTASPDVFERVIPMAFHVDYWDYLGWQDPYASKDNSLRQYQHRRERNLSQVYTPGILVDSEENRSWWNNRLPSVPSDKAGVLSVKQSQDEDRLLVQFKPADGVATERLQLNIAVLGMGLSTKVKAGENRGKELRHDFVVLEHQRSASDDKHLVWSVKMPEIPDHGQRQNALVVWLSPPDSQDIVQAVAGYL